MTVRSTFQSETKVGASDPLYVHLYMNVGSTAQTDKSYSGDNRLIAPKSSNRRSGLAPRCRLVTSWGWSRFQGFGCSPIKVARELGSERRETVRSLSVVGVGSLRRPDLSTRGPGRTNLWYIGCGASCTAEYPRWVWISAESI